MSIKNLRDPLTKHYASLRGDLEDLVARIARIKQEVRALDEMERQVPDLERQVAIVRQTLVDLYPEEDPDETPPAKKWAFKNAIPHGQCGRRAMNVLRKAKSPMTIRSVAEVVLSQVGIDHPTRDQLIRAQGAIESSFRKFEGRTVEASGTYPKQWRAINRPELQYDP